MPCDCEDGEVYIPGEGCDCGYDLVVRIVEFRPLGIPLGPGDNCFDPNCEIQAEADPGNVILECDETNNRDFLVILG